MRSLNWKGGLFRVMGDKSGCRGVFVSSGGAPGRCTCHRKREVVGMSKEAYLGGGSGMENKGLQTSSWQDGQGCRNHLRVLLIQIRYS